MIWIAVLLVSTVLVGLQASPAEDLIDEMIYELNQELIDKHQDTLILPAIDENFEKKVLFFKVHGKFTGDDGWFKNVSTIKRTGPLDMVQSDSSMTLGISLGLDDMEFGFQKYRIEVLHIGLHGTLTASVSKNSIYAHLSMVQPKEGPCKTTIDKLEVQTLDGFHVHMTGLGKHVDWATSYVVQFLANKYHSKIKNAVSGKLIDVATKALQRKDICEKFF